MQIDAFGTEREGAKWIIAEICERLLRVIITIHISN
jgi:hypothetical protein